MFRSDWGCGKDRVAEEGRMSEVAVGVMALFILLALFMTGIEMGFAMAIVGFAGYIVLVSVKGAMTMLAKDFYGIFAFYSFTVIPLFVLMGQISFNAGKAVIVRYHWTRLFARFSLSRGCLLRSRGSFPFQAPRNGIGYGSQSRNGVGLHDGTGPYHQNGGQGRGQGQGAGRRGGRF
jgi:hypothetical protein